MQSAPFEGKQSNRLGRKSASKALSSAEAMADYASRLFDFGHEGRALVAYQQVLHKDPTIFDRDALHLWKLAESHLGQGNLTLAQGYFKSLTEKHPGSLLSNFARIRNLDVQAVRMVRQAKTAKLPRLVAPLSTISVRGSGELQAQRAIRAAYWNQEGLIEKYDRTHIPAISEITRNELRNSYQLVENNKTAFVASNILLNDALKASSGWSRSTGQFAAAYFKRFRGKGSAPFAGILKKQLNKKLNQELQTKVTAGKLLQAVQDYDALPNTLRSVRSNPRTAWSLAEAYRQLGQVEKAVAFYDIAARGAPVGPNRFRAQFWLAATAGDLADSIKEARGSQANIKRLSDKSRKADRLMNASWKTLRDEEKSLVLTSLKGPLEKTITSTSKLRTPPVIILEDLSKSLSTKVSATSGEELKNIGAQFSPTSSTVKLITALSKRFNVLGMPTESRKARKLLKEIRPKDFAGDKQARQLWTSQLLKLAEENRKDAQYIEAGRLYKFIGEESENWEGRAETLYKGGLLLYRAGRRQEAVEAFQRASEDGNNLFYANLSKERLSQLK